MEGANAARQPRREQKTMANPPTNRAAAPASGGHPKSSKEAAPGQPRLRPQLWWLIVLALMLGNYVVTRVFFPEPSSITIPYTFFKQQVAAGNVETVSSVGDSIQGSFRTKVTYPPVKPESPSDKPPSSPPSGELKPQTAMRFKTQRPAFADPGL